MFNGLSDPDPANWTPDDITTLIGNIVGIALFVAQGITVIFVLLGAFYYLTAYGNEERASQGKKTILWALIGLIVMMVSRLVIASIWGNVSANPISFPF